MQRSRLYAIVMLLVSACATQNVRLAPVKVEPIHMTIDVNLNDSGEQKPQPATFTTTTAAVRTTSPR